MRHIKTFKQNSDHRNCSSIVFIVGVYFQPWRLCSAPRRKTPDCCLSRCNGRAFYLQRETFSSRCWKPAQEESLFASHRHKEPCCQSHSRSLHSSPFKYRPPSSAGSFLLTGDTETRSPPGLKSPGSSPFFRPSSIPTQIESPGLGGSE